MQKPTGSKWLRTFLLFFFAAILALFLSGCGNGNLPIFNIEGNWYVYQITNSPADVQGPGLFQFSTSNSGADLTGTAWSNATNITGNETGYNGDGFSTAFTNTISVSNIGGSVGGLGIGFSYAGNDNPTTTYNFGGTISADDTYMSGTWKSTIGTNNIPGQNGIWFALPIYGPTADINGVWNLTATGSPQIPSSFTLSQPSPEHDIVVTAPAGQPYTGAMSNLEVAIPLLGSDGYIYLLTGTASSISNGTANTMSGTWRSTNGQSGTWSAAKS